MMTRIVDRVQHEDYKHQSKQCRKQTLHIAVDLEYTPVLIKYILNNKSMYLGEVTKVNQGNNKKIHEDTSLRVLTKIILTHVRVD